ncbi:hypothetical protein [Tunicatimonas pelagia]|uniref:hypothetical protein n=1 Tax=Tunicatimonas pelagia TaxID=931531 RepID=UPI0026670EF5|nr:hypothetical protein [Tunicatimonas pelagia]WKN44422.1 hypothetical protein P0M28_05520 [Tunicatimonas pelagia]
MNLTNEDRELLDRHFEQDLTETEETQFQEKVASDDEFRQAVRLRELIHERVEAHGAAQLKEQLKANLAAQRGTIEEEEEEESQESDEATVRPLFVSPNTVRWAIAASLALVLAAAVVFLNLSDSSNGNGQVAVEDTTKTDAPVTGGQVEAPSYAGTDTYTSSYAIASEGISQVAHALLVIDESRTEATYQLIDDTLRVYYPQEIFADPLQLVNQDGGIVLQINEESYLIDLAGSATEQPLTTQE